MKALIGFLFLAGIITTNAFAQEGSFQGAYELKTDSEAAEYHGLEMIVVKKIIGQEDQYIIQIPYVFNSEYAGVLSMVNYKTKAISFDTGEFNGCEDEGCAGISSVRGTFVPGKVTETERTNDKIEVTVNFFKAEEEKINAWSEKLTFEYSVDLSIEQL